MAWTVCRFRGGGLGKKEGGGVFGKGWYSNAHNEVSRISSTVSFQHHKEQMRDEVDFFLSR